MVINPDFKIHIQLYNILQYIDIYYFNIIKALHIPGSELIYKQIHTYNMHTNIYIIYKQYTYKKSSFPSESTSPSLHNNFFLINNYV